MSGRRAIAVVGGGPAGATLAMLLKQRDIDVVLFEAEMEPRDKAGECLPPNTAPLLARLGLTPHMLADGHAPSYGIRSVWGSHEPQERDFIFEVHGHGWHLDRRQFERRLAGMAKATGVGWRFGTVVTGCAETDDGVDLQVTTLRSVQIVRTHIVVDATGRGARIARRLGARQARGSSLVGTMGVLPAEARTEARDAHTLVEAIEHGWWYSAVLGSGRIVSAVMTDPGTAPRGSDAWERLLHLAPYTRKRLRGEAGTAISRPLRRWAAGAARLERFSGRRWLAIGDAAAAFDPISSYGIASALGSAFEAADVIAARLRRESDTFERFDAVLEAAWRRYEVAHLACYSLEQRWPDSRFWSRQQWPLPARPSAPVVHSSRGPRWGKIPYVDGLDAAGSDALIRLLVS